MCVLLTLKVGDKRDNLEFVRLGGKGGVLPQLDSVLRDVKRERMGKFLGCLAVDNNVPFGLCCKNADDG